MFVENVGDVFYEKRSVSGIVYLTVDSQPEICVNFSELIEVRVVFDTALKSEKNSDTSIGYEGVDLTSVKGASPFAFDVEAKEIIDHALLLKVLEEKDHHRNTVSDLVTPLTSPDLVKDHESELPKSNLEPPAKKSKNEAQLSSDYVKNGGVCHDTDGKLRCEICMDTFTSEELFESHITANGSSHKCKLCHKTFPFEGYLLAHVSVYHRDSEREFSKDDGLKEDSDYSCHLCENHFKCLSELEQHMRVHTFDHYFKCCLCGEELRSRFDKIHMLNKHRTSLETVQKHSSARKKVKEKKKMRIFKTDRGNNGLYVTHGKGFACKMCKKNFVTKVQFRSHIRADGITHKCNLCEEKFPFQAHLFAHISMDHAIKDDEEDEVESLKQKKIRCHLCLYTGTTIYALRKHMVVHTKEDFFKCCVCHETVKELRPLRLHIGYHMNFNAENSIEDSSNPMDGISQEEEQYEANNFDNLAASDEDNRCEIYSYLNRKGANSRARQCPFCKEIFSNKRLFDAHLIAKTGRHKCEDCGVVFPTKAYLYAHISLSHMPDKKSLCSCHICEVVKKNSVELKAHMITHTDEYSFKCCICQEPVRRRKALSRHMKKHRDYFTSKVRSAKGVRGNPPFAFPESRSKSAGENIECDICSRDFKTMEAYEQHFRPEPKSHQCELCDQTFLHKNDVMVHMSLNHFGNSNGNSTKNKPKCHVCGEECTVGRLLHHMMTHTGEPVYKCCVCCKAVSSKIDTRHMRLHSKGGMVQCSCCNQLFPSMGDVLKHRNSVIGIHCSLCEKSFPSITGRNMHYRMAHPNEILRCSKCSRIFLCQEELNSHMKYHEKHKKKECPICGKFFSVLKLHLLTHRSSVDENEMYHCDQCPKKFTRLSSFQHHKMSHNKVAQFQCHLCTKSFTTVMTYRKHLKNHVTCTGRRKICSDSEKIRLNAHADLHSKVLLCRVCSKRFMSRHILASHMKNTHSVISVAVEKRDDVQIVDISKAEDVVLSSDEAIAELPYEDLKVAAASKDHNYHNAT